MPRAALLLLAIVVNAPPAAALRQTVLSWQEFAGKIGYVERSIIDGRPYAVLDFAYPNGVLVRRRFDEESDPVTRQQIQEDGQWHALLNFEYQEIEGMQLAVGRRSISRSKKTISEYRLNVKWTNLYSECLRSSGSRLTPSNRIGNLPYLYLHTVRQFFRNPFSKQT